MSEITPISKIAASAKEAANSDKPVNPYPLGHVFHDVWNRNYQAAMKVKTEEVAG